ncbi:hypothetical protein [Pengzhenrongella sp.]|uniref:hypothetical protein n=1 Tax=Pengzhenrongella sp. TaxID=2888820 RepID=UPI002F9412CE
MGELMGVRGRALRRAIRRESNLDAAMAVIVVGGDGSFTVIRSDEMDRAEFAQDLVTLAFEQIDELSGVGAPAQWDPTAA